MRSIGRGLASIAICVLAGFCMYITNSNTGIGWAIIGLIIIWSVY